MNSIVKDKEVFALKDLIPYKDGGVNTIQIIDSPHVRLILKSFDGGTCLDEHSAPGDVIVFALEGEAIISYKGTEYPISAGQNFKFEKDAMHCIKRVDGRFKMAVLLVFE